MDNCDCCGKRTDERSMQNVGKKYSVCLSCHGGYTPKELLEKIRAQEKETRYARETKKENQGHNKSTLGKEKQNRI